MSCCAVQAHGAEKRSGKHGSDSSTCSTRGTCSKPGCADGTRKRIATSSSARNIREAGECAPARSAMSVRRTGHRTRASLKAASRFRFETFTTHASAPGPTVHGNAALYAPSPSAGPCTSTSSGVMHRRSYGGRASSSTAIHAPPRRAASATTTNPTRVCAHGWI